MKTEEPKPDHAHISLVVIAFHFELLAAKQRGPCGMYQHETLGTSINQRVIGFGAFLFPN